MTVSQWCSPCGNGADAAGNGEDIVAGMGVAGESDRVLTKGRDMHLTAGFAIFWVFSRQSQILDR
jgi:hypothetical protein